MKHKGLLIGALVGAVLLLAYQNQGMLKAKYDQLKAAAKVAQANVKLP